MSDPSIVWTRCLTCDRLLDQADDLLSARWSLDCRGCMVEVEDGRPPPDLPQPELQDWLDARSALHRQWWDESLRKVHADLPDEAALRQRYGDGAVDHMLKACCPRFVADGLTEQQARILVLHGLPGVMEFRVPASLFDDLSLKEEARAGH